MWKRTLNHGLFLTARRGEPETVYQVTEGEVVEEEPRNADQRDVHPVGFGFALQDAKQDEIDKTAREGLPDGDVQNMGDHERQPIKEGMDDV